MSAPRPKPARDTTDTALGVLSGVCLWVGGVVLGLLLVQPLVRMAISLLRGAGR